MRVFVTGAAGFIGQSTVQELLKNGHQVLGLARSDASASAIAQAGAEPHKGDLKDLESLKRGAEASDGVIHLAFIHDFSDFPGICATDRAAITAIGDVLAGTSKPFVIASGTLGVPQGVLATEDTESERNTPMSDRARSADLIYAFSKEKQVRGSAIRLPPTVHGAGDWGFITMLGNAYREKASAIYVSDGSARWPAVHRDDAAVVLRLALEKGTAGATYNAVAEQGVPMKEITGLLGKKLQLPVKGVSAQEALGSLGFLGHVIAMDNPTSSEKTRRELGWEPTGPGLLEDVQANYVF